MIWLGIILLAVGAVVVLLLRFGGGPVSGSPAGEVGQRIRVSATIIDIRPYVRYDREFNAYKFRTDDDKIVTWFTEAYKTWEIGDRLAISGTVTGHKSFRGRLETIVDNVREIKKAKGQ